MSVLRTLNLLCLNFLPICHDFVAFYFHFCHSVGISTAFFRFIRNDKYYVFRMLKSFDSAQDDNSNQHFFLRKCFYAVTAPRLEWKSFFCLTQLLLEIQMSAKKDWERKAELASKLF